MPSESLPDTTSSLEQEVEPPARSSSGTVSFEREAAFALRGLQVAILDLLGHLPSQPKQVSARRNAESNRGSVGNGLRRPTDLQRALGIHNKLAWQIHRFAHASNPLAEASNLPGTAALERLLEAAQQRGVPSTTLDAVRRAERALDELIRIHAGDRGAFDSMVGELTEGGSEQIDLQHRRNAFRANSHILGIQARAQFCCFGANANPDDPTTLDIFSIKGLLDLRRLRTNVSCMVSSTRVVDGQGHVLGGAHLLDPDEPACNPAGMIRRFCSQPLPKFCTATAPDGYVNVDLEGEAVGNLSAITCVDGLFWRNLVKRYADEENCGGGFSCTIRNPLEVTIVDLLIHASCYPPGYLTGPGRLEAVLYSDHRRTDRAWRERGMDVLPLRESVIYLGRGAAALRTPEVSRYVEIAAYAFERLGWNDQEFDVYRCRIEYPFLPSSLRLQYRLPAWP